MACRGRCHVCGPVSTAAADMPSPDRSVSLPRPDITVRDCVESETLELLGGDRGRHREFLSFGDDVEERRSVVASISRTAPRSGADGSVGCGAVQW